MEELHINTSGNESFNYTNVSDNIHHDLEVGISCGCYEGKEGLIIYVFTLVIICISLPLILVAIYLLSSLVRKDHGAPVYIINLLISDTIQLLCMIVQTKNCNRVFIYFHIHSLFSSVGFMVCISLERYLVIAWPLWYRFRRTIKTSVVVSVLVWILPFVFIIIIALIAFFETRPQVMSTPFAVFFLLPLPLFIFFLGGTLKALSTSLSVPSDEKRRIVAVLVVVLLIYTLLFLPTIILLLAGEDRMSFSFNIVSGSLLKLSPLADLILYIFIRKGTTDKLLASLCCCRMQLLESSDEQHE